ncbi:MAG: helicase associated domain-containing protein [Terrimicrobiaceae bacterium]|nr:helicase associated domain-containing protein [Terrimicrobiaceae bacterium]
MLEEMGVEWNPREAAWMRQYEKLVEYYRVHGHFRISTTGSFALSLWTTSQRQCRKDLSSEQRRLLDAIGFPWNPQADELEERFQQLEAFKQKHGHCFVPLRGVNGEFPKLGRWMERLRAQRSKLPPEMVERLNASGFVWNVEAARWEQRFQELLAFHRRFGHCRVPSKWSPPPFLACGQVSAEELFSPLRRTAVPVEGSRNFPGIEKMTATFNRDEGDMTVLHHFLPWGSDMRKANKTGGT